MCMVEMEEVICTYILGVLQSGPSNLSAQSQVAVVILHAPFTQAGLQTEGGIPIAMNVI